MKALRDLFLGIITTAASSVLVIGAIFLATVEGMSIPHTPQPPAPSAPLPTFTSRALSHTPASTPAVRKTTAPTSSPGPTDSSTPTQAGSGPITCRLPQGWGQYMILSGDTIEALSGYYGISQENLMAANCLMSTSLLPGTILFVPPVTSTATITAVSTQTPIRCGPPSGWILYSVKTGDNLFRISLAYGVSVNQLQAANCLGSSTAIRAGQGLYVPNQRTNTPVTTRTFTPPPTSVPPTVNSAATASAATASAATASAAAESATAAAKTAAAETAAAVETAAQQTALAEETRAAEETQAALNTVNTQAAGTATAACETQTAAGFSCP